MNKQNKKIAQEKRRIEREKAEKKAKVVNLLKFWVPVVAVVVVVIVLIWQLRHREAHHQTVLMVQKLHHRPQNLRHPRHKAVIHRQRQQHLIQRLTRLRKTEIR